MATFEEISAREKGTARRMILHSAERELRAALKGADMRAVRITDIESFHDGRSLGGVMFRCSASAHAAERKWVDIEGSGELRGWKSDGTYSRCYLNMRVKGTKNPDAPISEQILAAIS